MWLRKHPFAAAILVYAVVCVPAWVWLVGSNSAGTIDPWTAGIALALGGIMLVPVVQSFLVGNFAASRVRSIGGVGD